ncbi:DNA adenine methylase [Rothia mucilaginosa]
MIKNNGLNNEILRVETSAFPNLKLPQPFPLQGSKRKQASLITQLIPADSSELIESFCGSAAVALAARAKYPHLLIHLNDINTDIINLWDAIINSPHALADEYRIIWENQFKDDHKDKSPRDYFKLIRDDYNKSPNRPPAEFLFILNRIVKGALRYNLNGEINQSADGRRVGAKPGTTAERIIESSKLLSSAHLTSCDWIESLSNAQEKSIIYLDPPYQGTTDTSDKRYIQGLSYIDFREGVEDIISKNLSALISYDAIDGPVVYGRPLHKDLPLMTIDVVTGVSAQGTLLGRKQEAHETLYLTPALVERLGGTSKIYSLLSPGVHEYQQHLF